MYSGVARSSYRQHSCDDVTKMGLCDWFTNELTDWRRRKEITYERIGRTSGPPIPKIQSSIFWVSQFQNHCIESLWSELVKFGQIEILCF